MSILISCWSLLMLFAPRTKGFKVQGAVGPLSVHKGVSLILPCSVDTPLPLNKLELQWRRAGTLLHMYLQGKSRLELQAPRYSGRAEFFTEEIPKGNFSLLLKNVTAEDKGVYKCRVHTDEGYNETNVEVDVEWLVVTGASEPVSAYAGENVILTCSVETHAPLQELQVEWVKTNEDISVLLFKEGQNIPESQHERFRGRAEFFTEEIPKGNFSLKLRGVRTEDRGEYMCKVHTDTDSVSAKARLQELDEYRGPVILLSVCFPCVMVCAAFIIWGVAEGSVGEAYTCSAINLMRILMLFKIFFEYENDNFGIFIFKHCAPIEHFIILTGVNSDVLWTIFKEHTSVTGYEIASVCIFVIILALFPVVFLHRDHSFSSGGEIVINVLETWFLGLTFGIILPAYFVLSGIGAVGVTISIILKEKTSQDWTERAHLYKKMSLVGFFLLALISSFMYLDIILENHKEYHAWMCLMAFLYILAVTAGFEFRDDFTENVSAFLWLFGAFALPIVNGVAVAVSVIQKATKGERVVEDLRVIILPFECFFLTCWIIIQVYGFWSQRKPQCDMKNSLSNNEHNFF